MKQFTEEQAIAIAEGGEWKDWTDEEKAEAKRVLTDKIMDGAYWEGGAYRTDMAIEIESVMTQFYQGKVERDEAFWLILDIWDSYIVMYAEREVEKFPDTYCVTYEPDEMEPE